MEHVDADTEADKRAYEHDEDDDDDDISKYKFSKFATTYFQENSPTSFTKKVIKQPLLNLRNEGDQLVSLSIWGDTFHHCMGYGCLSLFYSSASLPSLV